MDKKRILLAPLDWGLGHASRCIPLIKCLLKNGADVILAGDGQVLGLLRHEFPQLEYLRLPGYGLNFPKGKRMLLSLSLQLPKIAGRLRAEHRIIEKLIVEKKIDALISDNRYGLWTNRVPCIFITHQLFIQVPFGSKFINYLNHRQIKKFGECWVPDYEGEQNYSGQLSHQQPRPANVHFIGPLSRFQTESRAESRAENQAEKQSLKTASKSCKLLFILSGPEPQRSLLEEKILAQLRAMNPVPRSIIVQGLPENTLQTTENDSPVTRIHHLDSDRLKEVIQSAELIISRPGYSSIMDLACFTKKAVFVPTPGQTEQCYLAEKFKKDKIAWSVSQQAFDIQQAMQQSLNFSGFRHPAKTQWEKNQALLELRIQLLLKKCET